MSVEECRYRLRHLTAYRYSGRTDVCHSLAHLRPRESAGQELLSHRVDISPRPRFEADRKDYFKNDTLYFEILGSHDLLEVVSTATLIKTEPAEAPPLPATTPWDDAGSRALAGEVDEEGFYLANFLLPSRACPDHPAIAAFLAPSLVPGRDRMELACEIMERVFDEFTYLPGATDTSTSIATVLKTRQGVCQDFAHVMIAALRHLGIPVRYVSGYLETIPPPGKKKLQGADASHAWVEVWSAETGWIPFDPTNKVRPSARHIKVAHGRDYFDVQPLKGLFVGTGRQKLVVEVDVERI